MKARRVELLVTGVVQGVGFRPFCARTANAMGLSGTVRNTSAGVEITLEGDGGVIDLYINALREDHPDAAVIAGIQVRGVTSAGGEFTGFSVMPSVKSDEHRVLIPADLAVCEDCLAEMRNPRDRRYRYPFINCTNCGPRYTIIRELPYDRQMTTMSDFPMCPECQREYHDPLDRRFHAQPNACPVCGPKVRLCDAAGRVICEGEEAVEKLVDCLAEGKLAAIKGIGGFHIACLPDNGPVSELRLRKRRPDKPFALMVRDLAAAGEIAQVSPEAERLLTGVQRPIVLCPKRESSLSHFIAPGQKNLGLMLPYAPLHHLIMEKFPALVMTSANISDSPIVSADEGLASLSSVVDIVLTHNRHIHTAIDDSVLIPGIGEKAHPIFLRRARGYVPNPMSVLDAPDILAAGAQLKSTYALSKGGMLFPGQYLGDLEQLETAVYYKRSLTHFIDLYGIKPKILAFDKHPGYTAAKLAKECAPSADIFHPVQHHHAHLASALLDNRSFDPVIGVIFDGTGYGDDGTIWGGEFLAGNAEAFTRMGSLRPARLLGGEKAIREPWRYALALLHEAAGTEAVQIAEAIWPGRNSAGILRALEMSPVTTSCGRLFDAFSALLGLCPVATYDAQAPAALESAIDAGTDAVMDFRVTEENDFVILDWRNAIIDSVSLGIADKAAAGQLTAGRLAAAFHRGLARAVGDVCAILKEKTGIKRVALSGGVWQNQTLLNLTSKELIERGFSVLTHRAISPNDEGVSAGQAVIAAALRKH